MEEPRKLLLAAPPAGGEDAPHVLCFPTEDGAGAALERRDVEALLEKPSELYAALVAALLSGLGRELGAAAPAARVLARDPVALLGYFFLDRLVRVHRVIEREGAGRLAAPETKDSVADRLEWFRARSASSVAFNQYAVSRAAAALSVPLVAPPRLAADEPPSRAPFGNLNFTPPSLPRRVFWKLCREASKRFGKVPTLGLSYSTENFLDGRMYWPGRLVDLHGRFEPKKAADPALRRRLLPPAVRECAPAWRSLLGSFGLDAPAADRALEAFSEFLVLQYPTTLLEDAPENLARAREKLERFRGSQLLFSETGDTHTQTMLAAAKELGIKTMAFQHGSHYGFAPHATFNELEFAHCDRFIGWGWTRLPDRPLTRGIDTVALPAPWLSERRRRWRRILGQGTRKRSDVLLMTDKFFHFPPTIYTNRAPRMDFLQSYNRDLEAIARGLAGAGLTIRHKPFDHASKRMQSETIARLERELGGRYRVESGLDKGLSERLIAEAALTVWDEPGTGWFECLVSGLPALLRWPRLPSGEQDYAAEAFAELERVGVSHRSVESLTAEAARCAADPESWLAAPERAEAVARLCRRFAWTEDGWPRLWRDFVAGL